MNRPAVGIASVLLSIAVGATSDASAKNPPESSTASCEDGCPAGHECIDGACQAANHPKNEPFTGKLKMNTSCAYGSPHCNVCVENVPKQLDQIRDGFDTDASVYSFKWQDECGKNPSSKCFTTNVSETWHFQSLMRFATSPDSGSWLATTRSVESGPGRIGVIRMGTYDGSAYPWRNKGYKLKQNELVSWQRVGNLKDGGYLNHASGAQMLGSTLFTGVECFENASCEDRKALVRIVDLSHPAKPVQRAFIALHRHTADAAAARLKDGFLMMTHADDGPGENLYFYRSDDLYTGWTRIGSWSPDQLTGIDDNFGCSANAYQNMHLVTQCDGKLFLVGLCQDWHGSDWADLYRVGSFKKGTPSITKVAAKKVGTATGASFWYGGGTYVDPKHRMSLYATEATTQSDNASVRLNEFPALSP